MIIVLIIIPQHHHHHILIIIMSLVYNHFVIFQIAFRQMGIFFLSFFGFNCWWLDLCVPHHIPEVVFIRKTIYYEISYQDCCSCRCFHCSDGDDYACNLTSLSWSSHHLYSHHSIIRIIINTDMIMMLNRSSTHKSQHYYCSHTKHIHINSYIHKLIYVCI